MQYQVPQFIETEDKVVGPFSLRQFLYVGVAAGISGICYFLVQPWLFFIIAFILIGGALALSFVKINGRPLIKIGVSAFNFYWRPQAYIWKSDHPVLEHKPTPVVEQELPPIKKSTPAPAPKKTIAAIAEGSALHKSWEKLQTGMSIKPKQSDRQFLEKKMAERYQIFQRVAGDRDAARRIDYR